MVLGIRKRIQNHLAERRLSKIRLVSKDGRCNINIGNVKYNNRFALFADFWTSFVETRWRFVLIVFVTTHSLNWFIFSLVWYWLAKNNGDLLWQNPLQNHTPCALNVFGLTSSFLFSLETQTKIGYGVRAITPQCPGGITLFMIESLYSELITCLMGGVILAKISLPKKRAKAITFSDEAVICQKEDFLCFMFRVANLRKTLMVGSKIYGKLFRTTVKPDGETIIMDQINIEFLVDAGKDSLFFVCPLTLYHVINKASPFFDVTKDTLRQQEFELVVFMDSTAESTSHTCQVRTSFIPQEILWGYNFQPIISRDQEGKYSVDLSNFSKMSPVATAHCAHCFHNGGHHFHIANGLDNPGFQAIDISK
ncbi:hypothetical protein DPEC_G00244750 [Dallia pectoralis]|uniref:Uncharacterized protein n=1 Tax=Dallia pectoralis TaxID=75939 RepID=A0ACC2FVR0_DALPE|nr:hypothetical protein DPEC_G00244750 [Dallia pectoralis]